MKGLAKGFIVACLFALVSLCGQAKETEGLVSISVGKNVRVSSDHGDWALGEGLAAADLVDARHLIVCSTAHLPTDIEFYHAMVNVFYVSFDGGATWTSSLKDEGADPSCGFGNDGAAYAVSYGTVETDGKLEPATRVFRSNDGGKTWQGPAMIRRGRSFDRPYVTIDQTSGRLSGRVYIVGSPDPGELGGSPIAVVHSVDGGKSFQKSVGVPLTGDKKTSGNAGTMVVLRDGTLVASYRNREPDKRIQVTTSSDGGEHLTNPVAVAEPIYCGYGLGEMPQIAVDKSEGFFDGRLYIVWSSKNVDGLCQTLVAYSSDHGISWSRPVTVSDNERSEEPNSILPAVAVNNKGVVGVSWYAAAKDYKDGYALRFSVSMDGGDSFSDSVPPSLAGYSPSQSTRELLNVRAIGTTTKWTMFSFERRGWSGDTQPLTADASGIFHPFWYDNRTGVLQLWTAPVTVAGEAQRNGSPELAMLDDVTDSISLRYREEQYDSQMHTLVLDAVLTNTSAKPISGPLKVRVLKLSPSKGILEVVNATNGLTSAGAIWDWSAELHEGVLNPSQSSNPLKMVLRIRGASASINDFAGAKFEFRILGRNHAGNLDLRPTP